MATSTSKIKIKQGKSLILKLFVKDVASGDVIDYSTGFTARMQIRQSEQDTVIRDTLDTEGLVGPTGALARITLGSGIPPTGSLESEVANVVMTWDTAQAEALDLNDGTVREAHPGVGDLEILDASDEVIESIRVNFLQTQEVTL